MKPNSSRIHCVSNLQSQKKTASTAKMPAQTTPTLSRNGILALASARRSMRSPKRPDAEAPSDAITPRGAASLLDGQVRAVVPLLRQLGERPVVVHLADDLVDCSGEGRRVGRCALVDGDRERLVEHRVANDLDRLAGVD